MNIDKSKAERWSERIIALLIVLAFATLVCATVHYARGATVQAIPELTPEHRAALLEWVDRQEKIEGSLKANLAAITLSAAAGDAKLANAQQSVTALESELSAQKRATFWAKWKFSIFGVVGGTVLAVTVFFFTRAGLWLTSTAAKVGLRTVV